MKVKQFGTSQQEELIKDKVRAREVVQSVLDYGVSQTQLKQIIYLFSIELENTQLMKEITSLITKSRTETKSTIITGE